MQQEILVIVKPLRPALDDSTIPPVAKFMDTRLMIVNVLDTSSSSLRRCSRDADTDKETVDKGLGSRNTAKAAGSATADSELEVQQLEALEDWSAYYATEHSSVSMCTSLIEDCGRRSVSNNGKSYFVELDALEHAHYGAYYRFTMPYKLSKESKKSSEYQIKEGEGGRGPRRVLDGCVVQAVNRDVKPLLEAYQQLLLFSSSKSFNEAVMTMSEKSEWRKKNPSTVRRSILFYVNRSPDSLKEYARYSTLFEMKGWKCNTCTDALLRDSAIVDLGSDPVDAILIDYKVGDLLFNVILAARVKFGPALVVAVLYDTDADAARSKVLLTEVTDVDVSLIKPISPELLIERCNQNIVSQLMLCWKK